MKYNDITVYLFAILNFADGTLQPYISGGGFVKYSQYPHAVFLVVRCEQPTACGGSLLNQNIILTAAHCTEVCDKDAYNKIEAKYGHEDIQKMQTTLVKSYVCHQNYDERSVVNDIGLMLTKKPIQLNDVMKRVIIMKYPPTVKVGYVAGWGIDETGSLKSTLKHTSSKIQTPDVCSMGFRNMHPGVFCAGPVTGLGSARRGDSGGALVHDGCIQIGIVSYRIASYSLVAYTNVSYYFNWIMKNSKRLYCAN